MSLDFSLELKIPKTRYKPGEIILFEVIVNNPHGVLLEFLTISLFQHSMVVAKNKPWKNKKSLQIRTSLISTENSTYGFIGTSWSYMLKVPPSTPLTMRLSPSKIPTNSNQISTEELPLEISYYIQVKGVQTENFPLFSEEYPIDIVHVSTQYGDVMLTPPLDVAGRRLEQLERQQFGFRRQSSLSIDSMAEDRMNRLRLSPGPPRYSTLSALYIPEIRQRSWSTETLPPHFDEAIEEEKALTQAKEMTRSIDVRRHRSSGTMDWSGSNPQHYLF